MGRPSIVWIVIVGIPLVTSTLAAIGHLSGPGHMTAAAGVIGAFAALAMAKVARGS